MKVRHSLHDGLFRNLWQDKNMKKFVLHTKKNFPTFAMTLVGSCLWIFCSLFDTVVELFHSTSERLVINSMPKLKYWKMVYLLFRAIDKVKWGNPWDSRKLD